jgi:DeoR/GlpR family transcriptional regulator of sugar metabolism
VADAATFEPGFAAKAALLRAEKEAIAGAAAEMIEPGSTIGISAGTTTHALARHLVDVPSLTIVTNSVPAAETFHRHGAETSTVMLVGGLRTPSDALVGPFALAALREIHLDTVFLGVHGIDTRAGLTTPNHLEADTNRALIGAGRRLIVLADASKFGVIAIASIAPLTEIDVLITDASVESSLRKPVEDLVRRLIVVDPYDLAGPPR